MGAHWCLVHGALVTTQVLFGAGAVVGALGLPSFNPLLFALLREGCAGPMLLAAAALLAPTRRSDVWRERKHFGWCGVFIFGNQLLYIIGLKLSNAVAGATWQPSQPIFTALLALALGQERFSPRRALGMVIAFLGCALMVVLGAEGAGGSRGLAAELAGNACFFGNCLCTSLYVVATKPLLVRFPALAVTAYSYIIASVLMLFSAVAVAAAPPVLDFLCPDCQGRAWHVPRGALFALAYWILFQSCAAYALMTWGNRHASASLVSGYSVLQPVTAAALTALILAAGAVRSCAAVDDDEAACLRMPGLGDLGAGALVAFGLFLVISSEASTKRPEARAPLLAEDGSAAV